MIHNLKPGNTITLHRPTDDRPREATFVRWLESAERIRLRRIGQHYYDCVVMINDDRIIVSSIDLKSATCEVMK